MMKETASTAENSGTSGGGIDRWIFRDRESVEKRFGLEMQRILELYRTNKGKQELLQRMKAADPSLNGNADKALKQVAGNIEQLEKKESFFKKMLMLPVRATKAVGIVMWKHKILTAIAVVAAVLALLYFTPTLAPAVGEFGRRLVEFFKTTLGKLKMPTPATAVDAAGKVPITGGDLGPEVARRAAEAMQSPGEMMQGTQKLIQAARDASVSPEVARKLSTAAEQIFQSAAEIVPETTKVIAPHIVDPLQRTLLGYPPLP